MTHRARSGVELGGSRCPGLDPSPPKTYAPRALDSSATRFAVALAVGLSGLWAACDGDGTTPPGTGGGGAGGCPSGPQPLFELRISAKDASVPTDTTVTVSWSAGQEPAFVLSDPTTWKTLDDMVNVVCDVDHGEPPPTDLKELVCHLWTSSTTEVEVRATGWQSYSDTLQPEHSDLCDGPVPKSVAVILEREADGGMQ